MTAAPPPTRVLLGALNPAMAAIAADLADGAVTYSAGPKTIGEVIAPLRSGARAGEAFRLVAIMPLCVTDDVAGTRAHMHRLLAEHDRFPSYQKVLRREGVDGVAALAIAGPEEEADRRLDEFAAAGATDFLAQIWARNPADATRTWRYLAGRAGG